MKAVAILTDIHGNSPALKAVLDDINSRSVDHIYCLGDVVGIGPDSNKVMELLTVRNDITYILGNHDLAVMKAYLNEPPPRGHHNERKHHEWLAERIDSRYIDFMHRWPNTNTATIHGKELYFTHYHIKQHEWISIDKEPAVEKLDQMYAGSGYDLIGFGHHHLVHHFKSDERIYFNPGSLGCYHKPFARYGLIHFINDSLEITLKEIPYSNIDFLKSYEDLKVPERDFILKAFHGSQYGL
jgi:putative phosphoesterase